MSIQHGSTAQAGARLESESLGSGPAGLCDPRGSLHIQTSRFSLRVERPSPAPVSYECVRTDETKPMKTQTSLPGSLSEVRASRIPEGCKAHGRGQHLFLKWDTVAQEMTFCRQEVPSFLCTSTANVWIPGSERQVQGRGHTTLQS